MALFESNNNKNTLPLTTLRERYLVPPFSILHSQVNDWLKYRNAWEDVIKNRCANIRNITAKTNTPYTNKFDYDEGYKGLERNGSTSTFDPLLCEILIKWFSRQGDTILDPFAGGQVRGAVSGILGRNYVGVDINPLQVENNYLIWNDIKSRYNSDTFGNVTWICDDSKTVDFPDVKYNYMLTCPPYYNLEIYSDNPDDISTHKTYNGFLEDYRKIIARCFEQLDDTSFAAIVVAELRDKDGTMLGFVPDTIQAFRDAGFHYYNEMILENRIDSLGVRCPKYFEQSRKIGRHHQNVLIFYKGNPDIKIIESKFGKFTENNFFLK